MKIERVKEFRRFVEKQLGPAADDLEGLEDNSRKHIQKLVYTNLVDRFDSMIDHVLLDNCREEKLVDQAFKGLTQAVTEADLLKLLLQGDDLQTALDTRLKDSLRLSVLRDRHSRKLSKLFDLCEGVTGHERAPRVNPNNGQILESFKIQNKRIPHSICGYADWLYSRRNGIVHGSGRSSFSEKDKKQIKKLYQVTVANTFKISPSSIKNAARFYTDVADLILNGSN